jgi:hypothetical protein
MASLYNIFSKEDIGIILDALEKRKTFYATQAKSPIKGYGRATEISKKQQWAYKAIDVEHVIQLVANNCE